MIRFLDGPAKGVSLPLARIPKFLRVVQDEDTGMWDALDQLTDAPSPNERVFVYRMVWHGDNSIHLQLSGRNGGRRCVWVTPAEYTFYEKQPSDATMRSNEAWQAWAKAEADPPKEKEEK